MSWDGTGDQYHSDIDPRYPLFSDIQTTDYSLMSSHRPVLPREAHSYESEYLYSAQDLPAKLYYGDMRCPSREWPRGVPPMRRNIVEDREALAQLQYAALYNKQPNLGHMLASGQPGVCMTCAKCNGAASASASAPSAGASSVAANAGSQMIVLPGDIRMDANTFVLLFIFIIFIFVCYCMKSMNDLHRSLADISGKK